GVPMLKGALAAFSVETDIRWSWVARAAAMDLIDDDTSWNIITTRQVELARSTGMLRVLSAALNGISMLRTFKGEFESALLATDEADAIAAASGMKPRPQGRAILTAWQGRGDVTNALVGTLEPEFISRGEGLAVCVLRRAMTIQQLGLGNYGEALMTALE